MAKLTTPGLKPVLDTGRFAPYTVHPLPEIDWNLQIAKRGDQRQMETWQRLGTYAAGLALDDAGIKGDEALCSTMDMVVAAGGGERDLAVDTAILAASETRNDRDVLLNEKLTTELRPTLFLAQLSNLLAGNISIVHKVTGSSRTFMGEEGAGVSALETAAARIRSGQSTHMLVGGAFQSEHLDMLLGYEMGGYLHRGPWQPVWARQGAEGGGIVTGSGGAFLVLESREHAEKRGGRIYATLGPVLSGRARRPKDELDAAVSALFDKAGLPDQDLLAVSAASGAHAATRAEQKAIAARPRLAARGFSTLTGHLKEAHSLCRGARGPCRPPQGRLPGLRRLRAAFRRRTGKSSGDGHRLSPFRGHGARLRRRLRASSMADTKDHMGRPLVAVTGIGMVTSLGVGKQDNWAALTSGTSGIHPITRFPVDQLSTRISGMVDFLPSSDKGASALTYELAEKAAHEAIAESGFSSTISAGRCFSPRRRWNWTGTIAFRSTTAARATAIPTACLKWRAG